MKYPKINSLWKREGWYFDEDKKKDKDFQKGRQSFIIGDYSEESFGNIKKWSVDEKIDGTNIRLLFKIVAGQRLFPVIMGRTRDSKIPCHLLLYLQNFATWDNLAKAVDLKDMTDTEIYLFGEGYGPKIQSAGANYTKNPSFILFDATIGKWWLTRKDMRKLAEKLEIPSVPDIGVMTEEEIIDFVKSKPLSRCSMNPQMMEGVVCRSEPLMLFRNGKQIMWKLKCKEFE